MYHYGRNMYSSAVFKRSVSGANRQFEAPPRVGGQAQRPAAFQRVLCDMHCLVDRDLHFRRHIGSDTLVLVHGQRIRRLLCSHFKLYDLASYIYDSVQHAMVSLLIVVDFRGLEVPTLLH